MQSVSQRWGGFSRSPVELDLQRKQSITGLLVAALVAVLVLAASL